MRDCFKAARQSMKQARALVHTGLNNDVFEKNMKTQRYLHKGEVAAAAALSLVDNRTFLNTDCSSAPVPVIRKDG